MFHTCEGHVSDSRLWCLVWASFNPFWARFRWTLAVTPGRLWAILALCAVEASTGPHLVGHLGDRGPNKFWLWAAGRETDNRQSNGDRVHDLRQRRRRSWQPRNKDTKSRGVTNTSSKPPLWPRTSRLGQRSGRRWLRQKQRASCHQRDVWSRPGDSRERGHCAGDTTQPKGSGSEVGLVSDTGIVWGHSRCRLSLA